MNPVFAAGWALGALVGSCAQAAAPGAPDLPPPFASKSVRNFSQVVGWPEGRTPQAPEGFTVTKFADGLLSPRNIYVGPRGEVFVSEANRESAGAERIAMKVMGYDRAQRVGDSAKRVTVFRDLDAEGRPRSRSVLLQGLNQPYGLLVRDKHFYVANQDGLWRYPYAGDEKQIRAPGKKLLDLPVGGYNNHWTRNLIARPDGAKLYVSVGSGSNVGEHGEANEVRRAAILEINPDGTGERIFASGLRNPVGMAWKANALWTVVNERDGLGDDLVPDYLTSVREGGFYGWPYSYFGRHVDPRPEAPRPDLVARALTPDFALGSHTASLGLAFYEAKAFPERYRGGAFIGQHGSWNRSQLAGYRVVYVPFKDGRPAGPLEDFLTGFVVKPGGAEVYGRPVGVAVTPDGALLVADDGAGVIWQVRRSK